MISPRPDPNPTTSETWTVARLLAWTESYLGQRGVEAPRLDAELLLARALGCARLELYTGYERPVGESERATFRAFVSRRAEREPVAYILGEREFYSLRFAVNPAVLIPRPETEHVVETAIEWFGAQPDASRLLDLGTGSGNIAIAVLANVERCTADVVDRSGPALAVARTNAETHGVLERMRFSEGDLGGVLSGEGPRYDVIVSNPPYVAAAEYDELMREVHYEPREALVDDHGPVGDGLGYYRQIATSGAARLVPGGLAIVEVGEGQAAEVLAVFAALSWRRERTVKDYGGIERVVVVSC